MLDLIAHLTKEHRTAEGLLESLADSEPGSGRRRLIDDLDDALMTHMRVEERFLYPIVAEVMDEEKEEEAEVEHSLAREGVAKLHQLADEPGFAAAVDMLTAAIKHHVREEEEEVFPTLQERAADQIVAMDPDVLESRVEQSGTTRDDLCDRARRADIAGRSTTTRAELAEAIESQEP